MKLDNHPLSLYRAVPDADPVSRRTGRRISEEDRTRFRLEFGSLRVFALSALALCIAHPALSAESVPTASAPRLAGIVSVSGQPAAVLRVTHFRHSPEDWLILSPGQRVEDVEVTKITPEEGSVQLALPGAKRTTMRLKDTTNVPVPGIVLEEAGISAVLPLFAQFTNRTLLLWPEHRAGLFSVRAAAPDRTSAARSLEQALLTADLSIIPDGEKFLMIVPKSKAGMVKPGAPSAKSSAGSENKSPAAPPGTADTAQELLPPGLIDFRSADIWQVIEVYAMMRHRQFDRSERLPVGGTISLKTQTPLTKEEGAYAIETLLLWSGLKMIPVGEDRLKAVRAQEY
jgi:hypothetical protein